ncbi:DUF4274 domain-containing protein [Bacteroides sp. 224]|uniref:DUF4274 domain-containing protein n=1 Tax=Bacteroides sp. 224 TaxID=2302936 RepID=UPI0013D414C2|nr:DUF4274 domain-containing protein [Bacteroides sp. 224]NDV66680.1 DUF4274 domain-containing protein [Bacteroides sp. 224]
MYSSLSDSRQTELDSIVTWAACAGDNYYFNMQQADFEKSMKGNEEEDFYKAYVYQREIGLEKFQTEIAEKIAAIYNPIELHYLVAEYNYDDGCWPLKQVILNPACDIRTARMVYWLMQPDYYYDNFGGVGMTKNNQDDKLLALIEEKAVAGGFVNMLSAEFEDEEVAEKEEDSPYSQIPAVLWLPEEE